MDLRIRNRNNNIIIIIIGMCGQRRPAEWRTRGEGENRYYYPFRHYYLPITGCD